MHNVILFPNSDILLPAAISEDHFIKQDSHGADGSLICICCKEILQKMHERATTQKQKATNFFAKNCGIAARNIYVGKAFRSCKCGQKQQPYQYGSVDIVMENYYPVSICGDCEHMEFWNHHTGKMNDMILKNVKDKELMTFFEQKARPLINPAQPFTMRPLFPTSSALTAAPKKNCVGFHQ